MLLAVASTGGCSLLAPSRDEATGGEVTSGGGTAGSGGAAGGGAGGSAGSSSGATGGTGAMGASGGTGATGGTGAAGGTGATGGTGGTGGTGATGGGGGWNLIYEDNFDADNNDWSSAGAGNYQVSGGELHQTNESATDGVRWVTDLNGTDYRVEARVRLVASVDGAYQIVFRLGPAAYPAFYYCSWHPQTGMVSFGAYDGANAWGLGDFTADPMTDPAAPVTLTVEATGNQLRCYVPELSGVDFVVIDSTFPSGGVGVKTYYLAAAFDSFRVYAP